MTASQDPHRSRFPPALLAASVIVTAVLLVAVLARGGGGPAGSSSPASARSASATLLDGGKPAFRRRLAALRGTPVVVNQWASWCVPCRTEFPFLRSEADKRKGSVAFLGVDALDARDAAVDFLAKQPTPYEHFFDKKIAVARSIGGGRAWPTTAFYDARGEQVYVRQGAYRTRADLAADIDRYALGG